MLINVEAGNLTCMGFHYTVLLLYVFKIFHNS